MTGIVNTIPPYQAADNEEYMNDQQKSHFTAILEAWKEELMEESKRTVNTMRDEHTPLSDPNDRASLEEEFAIELRTRDRERKLLHKIEKTLDKLLTEDYGYCDICGVEIGIRRLEARPTADLCIDCKQIQERKEKSHAA